MSDSYPDFWSEEDIERIAVELVLQHGDNALTEAEKEISASNARGNLSLSSSWVLVCKQIRQLQVLNGYGKALNEYITLSE